MIRDVVWRRTVEGSRIDTNPLSFSFDSDLGRNRQGTSSVQVAPGPSVSETAWLELIRAESDQEVARRLGITDRQVRRIKAGRVSEVRLREHARADPKHRKEACRPRPARARAASCSLPRAADSADSVSRIPRQVRKDGTRP
jgi:hypothetical protein